MIITITFYNAGPCSAIVITALFLGAPGLVKLVAQLGQRSQEVPGRVHETAQEMSITFHFDNGLTNV